MELTHKKITLSLKLYLDDTIAHNPNRKFDKTIAKLISLIDNDEQFVHVQFHKLEHLSNLDWQHVDDPFKVILEGSELDEPLVWWIKAWRTEYPKYVKEKVKAAQDRITANKQSEAITLVAKALMVRTGLSDKAVLPIATKLILHKDMNVLRGLGFENIEL